MPGINNIWVCPYCNTPFEDGFHCRSCDIKFPVNGDQPDLRVTMPVTIKLEYNYTPEFGYFPWDNVGLEWPSANTGITRQGDWQEVEWQMLQAVPKADKSQVALDIGCGMDRQRFKGGLQMLGYESVGVDITGPAPDAHADAHCLPFKNETFDLIMSSAVFEHLKNPYVAMKELYRVAKPDAKIIMSIAYNEPFHISYFHHSPLAAHELFVSNNIQPDRFVISKDWNSFSSNLYMGYAGTYMPPFLQKLISRSIMGYSLMPAIIKGMLKGDSKHIKNAKMAFARSHSGIVGIIAHKKG